MSSIPDLDGAQQWVDDWQARILDKATRARELTARVAALRATGESRDGAVRVTVDSTGVPAEIGLGDAVTNWRPERISSEIMAAMRRAQQRLTAAVTEAAEATVGADSETGRAVLGSYHTRFPAEPTEPTADGSGR